MRGMTAVLGLILAACSPAGGDTTTTASLPAPSTTSSTTARSTTTTTEPATTTIDECVDRDGDGVLRTARGFVCPPTMAVFGAEVIQDVSVAQQYQPGTYVTRHLTPRLSFTRSGRFRSTGEDPGRTVAMDSQPAGSDRPERIRFVEAFTGDLATGLRDHPWETVAWAADLQKGETELAGRRATWIEFTVDGEGCSGLAPVCLAESGDGPLWSWNIPQRVRLVFIEVHEHLVTVNVQAHPDVFSTYWTETARPILDSIEFLDQ